METSMGSSAPDEVHPYDAILTAEIAERRRADTLITSQNRSLEMIVTGSPLSSTLSYLAGVVEMQSDSRAIASILLLDEEGNLRNGASPSLPDDYIEAINGLRPCVNLGTCCSAAATGQVVITPDIETDSNWAALKHLPLGLGFRAAWSQPLIASDGRVLGTFGTYFRDRRGPTPFERQAVEMLGRTAALAIERSRATEALRNTQLRLEKLSGELEQLVEKRTDELVQSQGRLRELASELNLAEQRERRRLAIELHDHLQQLLVLGKLKLGQGKRLAKSLPAVLDVMQQTDDVLSDALNYTRSLVAELSPPVLREHGLVAGLKWLAEWMQRHDLQVTVDSAQDTVALPEERALLLFQSVRELLINAAKHAKCHQAWVEVTQDDQTLCISVRDEGAGFESDSAAANATAGSSKFGLFSIRERMKALGGSLEIETALGRGTTCVLKLPRVDRDESQADKPHLGSESPKRPETLPRKAGTIGVVLVDDHGMIREGLRAVLANYPDICLLGEAADGEEAISLVRRVQPSVVIMDINMPKMNGIEATAHIKAQFPHVHIIGLSVNTEADNQEAMHNSGAARLLTKEAAVDELCQAIQSVLREVDYKSLAKTAVEFR
jgi:signal transduction histidine kinase/CheY-like chemotaxis protein